MNMQIVKSDVLLFITALIWGFAFVAQRVGMDYVGPFTFNGVRFALGALFLLPLIAFRSRSASGRAASRANRRKIVLGGLLAGFVLFAGASLQQVGLVYTTAGNAGFITGLYVVIVPILSVFLGQRTDTGTWVGAVLAVAGLYLLCATGGVTVSAGDILVLAGAFFWAGHVLVIGWLSPKMDSFGLAFCQYMACAALSLVVGVFTEIITLDALVRGAAPILYGGVMSVGIAYTLQVVGQKHAPGSHAAILMSLEAVFAAVGGWLLLGERLTSRQYLGCSLMLTGMLVSQLWQVCFMGKAAEECDDSGEKGFTASNRG
ncbi:MAG TPA: DMT family transporter [Deltaproteobacteria bacterium]|nr:DMT family transporter [Deltaproteobacteria bacterium]